MKTATGLLPADLLRDLFVSLWLLGSIGLLAIGASGLLAGLLGGTFGADFVAGDMPGVTYTPARCADFDRLHPEAGDCTAAAIAHHYDEVVEYRVAAGVLGALSLAVWFGLRATLRGNEGTSTLPRTFTSTVGASVFGVAALALLGLGSMQVLFRYANQTGALLSGGIVSGALAIYFAVSLLRELHAEALSRG
jgi:hypothetical protein